MCIRDRYTILQLVSTGGTGAIACRVVEAVTAPNYKVQVCSGRKVVVTIADDSTTKGYESFLVNFGGSVFIPVSYTHLDVYKRQVSKPFSCNL